MLTIVFRIRILTEIDPDWYGCFAFLLNSVRLHWIAGCLTMDINTTTSVQLVHRSTKRLGL